MFQMFQEFETESEEEESTENERVEGEVGHRYHKNEKDTQCVRCGSIGTLYNDNENVVCTSCGCDNGMILDSNPEWRFYGADDNRKSADPNRCGMPVNPYIKNGSLSIVILGRGFETYRKVNSWNGLTYRERSLMTILNMVMNKANIENVPQAIIDKTIFMYQTIIKTLTCYT
jgi:transcription initiation factor TFIIIB Brf1 subunit/transcription initiation factor TFIIB